MYTVQRYFLDENNKWEHIITSSDLNDCNDLAKMLSGITRNTACRVIRKDDCKGKFISNIFIISCFKNCEEINIDSEDWITA